MKNMRAYLSLLFVSIYLCSCELQELPVPAHDPGAVITSTVDLSSSYKWQIYFDLESNAVKSQVAKSSWDLGFECGTEGYRVILNTAKFMFAYNTGLTEFNAVTDTSGFGNGKSWDAPSGNLDSTAIGDWRNTNTVFIIDRGYDEAGAAQGFRKLQLQAVDASGYTFRFARLSGAGETTFHVSKDDAYNFSFLSLNGSGAQVNVEPPKDEWDLCFTQYTHIFYDPFMPYLVTGCLHNRYHTGAVLTSSGNFSALTYSDTYDYEYSAFINTIGYDWKIFSGSTYATDPNKCYLIKNRNGHFYKLHFIDFYNSTGDKGNPKWEYQQL